MVSQAMIEQQQRRPQRSHFTVGGQGRPTCFLGVSVGETEGGRPKPSAESLGGETSQAGPDIARSARSLILDRRECFRPSACEAVQSTGRLCAGVKLI